VEFQVFADRAGQTVHLFERECSVQRRHQKIIEETPSCALTPEMRARMGDVAVRAARAVGYVSAGTVEFLVDANRSFYFLEMNTRLQVEHPITEMVTGVDLVALQVRVAAGEPLPIRQEEIEPRGHAVECRIYAEDPENGFLPSPGRLSDFRVPGGVGVRMDAGVYPGAEVSVYYDPIIGKLLAWAEDRERAIARMRRALREMVVKGIRTNVKFLDRVFQHPAFLAGDYDTHLLRDFDAAGRGASDRETEDLAIAVAVLHASASNGSAGGPRSPGPASGGRGPRVPGGASAWRSVSRARALARGGRG
jgi:acetyl-CoA carboxylase biotin carboxylase subunit